MTSSATGSDPAARLGALKNFVPERDEPTSLETQAEREAKPTGAVARIAGLQAVAAAALALFAPLAIALLAGARSAPSWSILLAVICAAPLIAVAGAAMLRPASPRAFALAMAPLVLGSAWFAWALVGPNPVWSPAAPWLFASVAAAGLLAGRSGALLSAAAAIGLGGAFLAFDQPAVPIAYFTTIEDRNLVIVLSWTFALFAFAATAWAAMSAWASALPPLRRPTIAARRALSLLAADSAVTGLRVSRAGVVIQAVGSPDKALDLPRDELQGIDIKTLAHPDDLPQLMAMMEAAHKAAERRPAAAAAKTPDPSKKVAPQSATIRLRSRSGAFEWVEATAAPAREYPEPPNRAADPRDAILILRSRWRSGDAVSTDSRSSDSALLAQVNSHLKGSIKSIHGYTEILSNEIFGPLGSERYREYAKLAHDDSAKLLGLVDELLDLAEIEAGRFVANAELIDPVPLLDGAVRNLAHTAERLGVSLVPEFPPNAPYIRVDRRALRRALSGLALDGLRRADIGDQVSLRIDVEEGTVRFSIVVTQHVPPSGGAQRIAAPAHPSGSASIGAPPSPEEEAEREAMRASARLSRLVARSLVERMNGAIFIAPDAERPMQHRPLVASEAIFETPASASVESKPVPSRVLTSASPVGFAPDDGASEAAKARRDAEETLISRPLFARADEPAQENAPAETEGDAKE